MYENAILRLRSGQHEFEKRINFLHTALYSNINSSKEAEGNLKSEIIWTRNQIREFESAIKKLGK